MFPNIVLIYKHAAPPVRCLKMNKYSFIVFAVKQKVLSIKDSTVIGISILIPCVRQLDIQISLAVIGDIIIILDLFHA
jgi:hypothetical protein